MKEKELLTSATRIVYSVKDISNEMRVHWSRLLKYFFHAKLTPTQIKDHELEAAIKPFKTENESIIFLNSLSDDDQRLIVSAIKLLLTHASARKDKEAEKSLMFVLGQGTKLILNKDFEETNRQFGNLLEGYHQFKQKQYLRIPGSILLSSIDYSLRWIVLIISNTVSFEGFFPLGILIIPILIFGLAFYLKRRDRIYNERIIEANNPKFVSDFKFTYSTAQYTILAIYIVTGSIISLVLSDDLPLFLASLFVLIAYHYLLLQTFPLGRLDEHYSEKKLTEKSGQDFVDADENDERIVLLETQLNSNTGRLEAYVLESALFGALAFSAFLQIFATNLISFTDVEKFALSVQHLAHGAIAGNLSEFKEYLVNVGNKESLFSLISIETLICSGLFVAVIASRLRFSHVADQIRTEINLAKAYNEKEEKILESNDQTLLNSERFTKINQRIHHHLGLASKKIDEIKPIVNYIVYFRNLGVLVFASVLITSCFFISTALAWAFLIVSAATWVYFNLHTIAIWVSGFGLRAKIYFARHSYSIMLLSLLFFFLGYFIQINFGIGGTDYLISLSFLFMSIYLTSVFRMSYDARFGEIEVGSRWNGAMSLYKVAIFLAGIGFTMTSQHLAYSKQIIFVSIGIISALNFLFAFYLTRPKWLSLFFGVILAACSAGFLFHLMDLIGSREAKSLAIFGILATWIIYFIRKDFFHRLFVKILIIHTFIIGLVATNYFFYHLGTAPVGILRLAYQHRTVLIAPLLEIKNQIEIKTNGDAKNISEAEIKRSLAGCEDYINKYGANLGITEIHHSAIVSYQDFAEQLGGADSLSLTKAYLVIQEADKIAQLFNFKIYPYYEIPANILKRMGKKQECIDYYKRLLAAPDDYVNNKDKESIRKDLESLEREK